MNFDLHKGFFIKKNMAQIGQISKKKKFRQISSWKNMISTYTKDFSFKKKEEGLN